MSFVLFGRFFPCKGSTLSWLLGICCNVVMGKREITSSRMNPVSFLQWQFRKAISKFSKQCCLLNRVQRHFLKRRDYPYRSQILVSFVNQNYGFGFIYLFIFWVLFWARPCYCDPPFIFSFQQGIPWYWIFCSFRPPLSPSAHTYSERNQAAD